MLAGWRGGYGWIEDVHPWSGERVDEQREDRRRRDTGK